MQWWTRRCAAGMVALIAGAGMLAPWRTGTIAARAQSPEQNAVPQQGPTIFPTPARPVPDSASVPTGATPAVATAPSPRPLVAPAEPQAEKAYRVLETHCARCHQGGRLKRPAPASGFGNILRLDEIAAMPSLVRPGNPDGSRLYTHMLRRLMPYDVHQDQSGGAEPSPEEMQAVRTWIAGLPANPGCPDRRQITSDDIGEALTKAGAKAGWDAGRQRFVSLAHLHNACQSAEALAAWQQAVAQLFNGVSWRPGAIRVEPVDEARTLLRVDLGDLGWVGAHWDRIVRAGGPASGRLLNLPTAVRELFGAETPIVRGDWLASVMLTAPLYYELLGLPEIGTEIMKILNLDADALRKANSVQRLGVKASQFSRNPRLIDRLQASRSALWLTYDVQTREGAPRDPTQSATLPATQLPAHDASLAHFTLPNGFPAFFLMNQRGERIDSVPADLQRRSVAGRAAVRGALDCLACHGGGPALPAEDGKPALGLTAMAVGDRTTIRAAAINAGLTPGLTVDGVEPITALAQQYKRPLTLERAAAELGVRPEALDKLPDDTPAATIDLVRRLTQSLVSRAEFEAGLPGLLAALRLGPASPAQPAILPPTSEDAGDPGPTVELLSDKSVYRSGDAMSLTVKASADCHLTVISIDGRGRGTVIFPSDFEQNNFLSSGRTMKLPGEGMPYLFKVKEKGREHLVAICSPTGGAVDGIKHDFERQRFTDLGDYATFLQQATAAEALERKQMPKPAVVPASPLPKNKRGAGRDRATAADARPKADSVQRTAISIEVN